MELIAHEESRETFKLLRQQLKPFTRSQLQSRWVTMDDNGNYIKDIANKQILNNQEDIHTSLFRRNADHLGQAPMTPFARGSFCKQLKWDGTGQLA